jgi:HNH endonuclease
MSELIAAARPRKGHVGGAPHLTDDNAVELLPAARHKTKREVEHMVAMVRPLPPVPSTVRKLPAPLTNGLSSCPPGPIAAGQAMGARVGVGSGSSAGARQSLPDVETVSVPSAAPPRQATVTPLAPARYTIQITVSGDTYEKLRRAQDLMRHVIPSGDPAAIFDHALTLLVAELERTRLAATTHPRKAQDRSGLRALSGSAPHKVSTLGSRHVPAAVKREVWARDQGRCAFVGTNGRCTERDFLELHHVVPFAAGGRTNAENLELRCRAHNQYEAEQWFGPPLWRETRASYSADFGPDRRNPRSNRFGAPVCGVGLQMHVSANTRQNAGRTKSSLSTMTRPRTTTNTT